MKDWENLEENLAKMLDGERARASGAVSFQKCDVESDEYVVECKFTSGDRITLDRSDLGSLWSYSVMEEKTPLLALSFGDPKKFKLFEIDSKSDDWSNKTRSLTEDKLDQVDSILGFEISEISPVEFGWWN